MIRRRARAAWVMAIALIATGCLEATPGAPPVDGDPASPRRQVPRDDRAPRLGAAAAPIEATLFVDFTCPHSREAFERAVAVGDAPGDVGLAVRFLPLPGNLHAATAARAALAAHRQGRFLPMARALFSTDHHDRASVVALAGVLGLAPARFERDLDDPDVAAHVRRDVAVARALGVDVTPWWFVNGVGFKGKLDDGRLAAIVEAERGYVAELTARGVAPSRIHAHIMAGAAPLADAPAPAETLDPELRYAIPVGEGDLAFGPVAAPVTAVLFADVECPHTRRMWRALDRVRTRFGTELRLVIKHDPLPRHRFAVDAHLALAAAARLGHGEALFARLIGGRGLRRHAELIGALRAVGLDPARVEALASAPAVVEEVRAHRHLAARFGVRGTPTTFINGRPVVGVIPPAHLAELVAEELEVARATPDGPGSVYDRVLADARTDAAPPTPSAPHLALAESAPVTVGADDPTRGPVDAPVTVVAFLDFECGHSADAARALERLRGRHGDRVRTVFKHLPLAMHDHARNAAAAALAAQRQGRFWEMHDWLFANQASLDRRAIEAALPALGLDPVRFARDFDDPDVTDLPIAAAEADGQARGFTGTPTFVIAGHVVPGLIADELLDELVEGAAR